MMITYLVHHIWLSLGVWIFLHISDYYLTLTAARMYHQGVNQHFIFEKGYELNPYFEQDIALLKRFSPRFFGMLVYACFMIWVIWFYSVVFQAPALFEAWIGGFFLLEVSVHMRHVRNIFIFSKVMKSKGVQGRIEYSRWFALQNSFVDFIEFSVLFLLVFLLSNQVFFLGGAMMCLMTGLKHWRLSKKEPVDVVNPSQKILADAE